MVEFSTEYWVLLALALIIGLLLGLILGSNPKWKRRWREERDAHEALRRDHDARIHAANERIAELERTSPAVGAGTGAAVAGAARGNDDLSLIRGIGPDREIALNEAGVHRYKQLAKLSDTKQAEVEGRLGLEPGTIEREQWRQQADLLAHGKEEEFRREYGDR